VGRRGRIGLIIVFEVNQAESGRNQVEGGKQFLSASVLQNTFLNGVAKVGSGTVEDGVAGAGRLVVEDVPALQTHQPGACIGLRVEIDEKNTMASMGKTGGKVDDHRCLPDPSLVINKTDFSRHTFFGFLHTTLHPRNKGRMRNSESVSFYENVSHW